jgi:hypothetical protein
VPQSEGTCSFEVYDYKTRTHHPCTEPATFEPDPYAEEIHDDSTPVWICESHYQERKDDI